MQFNGDVVYCKPHGAGFHVLLATDGRVGVMYFRDGKVLRASWSVHSRNSLILIGSMGSRRVPVARSAYRFGLSYKLGLLFHCGVDLTFRRKIYEGEFEVAKDEDDLIKTLADDDNQDMLLTLEGKLKTKKLAAL